MPSFSPNLSFWFFLSRVIKAFSKVVFGVIRCFHNIAFHVPVVLGFLKLICCIYVYYSTCVL